MLKISTDEVNKPILGNMTIVAPSGGPISNLRKWLNLVSEFATNTNAAIWWLNVQPIQMITESKVLCASDNVCIPDLHIVKASPHCDCGSPNRLPAKSVSYSAPIELLDV